jgi:hypothetical protein
MSPRAIAQEDESIRIMQGSMYNPSAFERGNYMKVLSLHRPENKFQRHGAIDLTAFCGSTPEL